MTALYSNPPLADFIVSEAPGQRSRDNVVVVQTGTAIPSGTVLQAVTNGSLEFNLEPEATGNPTLASVTVGATAVPGVYKLAFSSATAFTVYLPSGQVLGSGTVGTAFTQGGLTFTVTAGTTAAEAGDEAVLNVTAAGNVHEPYNGSGTASGILYSHLRANTGKVEAVAFTMDCEVKRSALIGLTAAAETNLKAIGIKVRGKAGLPGINTPAL